MLLHWFKTCAVQELACLWSLDWPDVSTIGKCPGQAHEQVDANTFSSSSMPKAGKTKL